MKRLWPLWALAGLWLLCTYGCASVLGTTVAPRAGAEQATWIIWQSYGRTDPPPLIRWVEGKHLNCDCAITGKRGFLVANEDPDGPPVCHAGMTWSAREVLVAWQGELSFAETPLAEELEHAELLRRGVYGDVHRRPDFQARVDLANAAVREAGR